MEQEEEQQEEGGLLARAREGGSLVNQRWYDARARVALQRMCRWLQVPWPKLVAFETMWAMQVRCGLLGSGGAARLLTAGAAGAAGGL